ncbi:MAG TPA: DUF1707 domain-containing protein [Streptosporangiaceae bacterium]|nr:DUF1707 domain-containing protein [Streptosporangiaceae bacterium]
MDDRQKMRASDGDREEVVERLRAALEDGRLKTDEYLNRMGLAYEAVTYGDLAPLYSDLPESGSMAKREATAPAAMPQPVIAPSGVFTGLPAALRVLWTIWLTAVSINVVVWVLVSGTTGHLIYPWPIWVAGPSGAALFAVSAGVTEIRRNRRPAPRRLPAGKG